MYMVLLLWFDARPCRVEQVSLVRRILLDVFIYKVERRILLRCFHL